MVDPTASGRLALTDPSTIAELRAGIGARAFVSIHRRLIAAAAVIAAAACLGATLYHPPLAVIEPGPALDISRDISISGVPWHRPSGRYLLTSVRFRRPNVWGAAVASLLSVRDIVSIERDRDRIERLRREFRDSRITAAIAAARADGLDGSAGPLPFEIRFRERDVLGPSAGLAFALAIADMLSPDDLSRGRTVAATGRIDPAGAVGPVGGMTKKAVAVREAGARVFLVPRDDIYDAQRRVPTSVGVETLEQAIRALRA
jgi:PDZ domain-containing protein